MTMTFEIDIYCYYFEDFSLEYRTVQHGTVRYCTKYVTGVAGVQQIAQLTI